MDDNTRYYKDPPKLIYELMQDTFRDRFTYFLGSPLNLAAQAYPCIVIQPVKANNTVDGAPTGQDSVAEQINIHILYLETMNAATQGNADTTMRKLYNIVQGRDPATGFYMSGTVLYALRTNIDLGTTILDHDIDIDYTVSPDADKAVIEAIVGVVTRERVSVPNRV